MDTVFVVILVLCLFSSCSKSFIRISSPKETQQKFSFKITFFPSPFLTSAVLLLSKQDDEVGSKTSALEKSDPFLKHSCKSCAFVYDEEKGFKKRFPPGTRLRDLQTFMCPVCGAAIDQFVPIESDQK
mmetsp:Transcript_32439/g.44298  ORF Transcript_32439/g.44298 Transcript_32439/m.44298 type:complete len:128 (-) Transcript_32439:77-460(-)